MPNRFIKGWLMSATLGWPHLSVGALPDALEEVVVEAQRRSQALVEIPLPVSVVTGELLDQQRLYRVESMAPVIPGLSGWEQGPSTPIYSIRGISSNSFGIGGEASVALFVDDTYRGRINSTSAFLVDVAQLEVLRGPQGTLFGRNASAGAILVRHRLPEAERAVEVALGAGDNGWQSLETTVNLPLSRDWGLRASGFYSSDEGFTENTWLGEDVGDRESLGGQAVLAYSGTDLDMRLWVASQSTDSGGLGYETLSPALAAAGGVRADPFDSVLATDIDTYDDVESHDVSLQFDWQLLESIQLQSISAWHKNDSPNLFDVDGSAVFLVSAGFTERQSETLSQEFRLQGKHTGLDWVAGTLWFQEDINTRIELAYQPSIAETALQEGDYSSFGVYADATWQFAARWSLGLGIRYSRDDKEFEYNAPLANPLGNLLGYSTEGWEELDEDWSEWQPRLSLNWQFQDDHNAFANIARGYKAGGFEPSATPELSVFDPEDVWNLDLGLRGQINSARLQYQLNAFVYDYQDYQVQVIANGLARTGNVEGVDGRGIELELTMQALERWQLRLTGAWLDAEFESFINNGEDLEGNSPILSPEYSASFSSSWRSEAYNWGAVGFNWLSYYQSRVYFTVQNTADARQSGFDRHDLVLNYFAPSQRWQVDGFVRNLFDKEYRIFERDVGAGPVSRRGEPRVWGLLLRARF